MSNIDKRALREAAEKALNARARLALMESVFDDDGDDVKPEAQEDISICVSFNELTNPATVLALLDELEIAEKRIAELQSKSMRPVAWMRSDDITTFGPIFTKNENYAVEQWGDNAVALYASPVNFKLACFTDERNLKYINERGRETSLIWSERNSENGDVQLFRAAGIGVKGE
ncbi:ead/Ea22-like family protein [Citrobacter freundii]|uniref:ead/Ea22-like family protein n=1 Tax=Citrobacter freundii TaxID=546 RepID=UPI0004D3D80F|nr:ead/Ea22-like family protein [Citrobacter freundii]KEL82292.1 ead/Ea22-like family protein [Citrobacter freundii]